MTITFKPMEPPKTMELNAHPLADLFPMMEGEAFSELVDDIKEHGLREPIVLLDNQILDGRNRLKACREGGVEPKFAEYHGNDPTAFVVSLNLKRRHLSESQRAYVAGKLATMKRGGDRKSDQRANLPFGTKSADAAKLLNVSPRSVKTAKQVQKRGTPELNKAVEGGEISISAAATVATLPANKQIDLVAKGEKAVVSAAKQLRKAKEFNDAVRALPEPEPWTDEDKEALAEAVGTQEQRSHMRDMLNVAKTVSGLPSPETMPGLVPPAYEYEIREEMPRLEAVSKWFDAFVSAWKAKEKTIDAA